MPTEIQQIADIKETAARFRALQEDWENTMLTIITNVASGGSLIDLCKMWKLNYGHVIAWINREPILKKQYREALEARDEWRYEKIMREFETAGFSDLRQLFKPDGSMLPPHEWPDGAAAAVASIEVDELFEGTGKDREQIGITRKVKLWDKTKSLESLAKILGKFVTKTDVSVTLKLEDMLSNSYPPPGWVETTGKEIK